MSRNSVDLRAFRKVAIIKCFACNKEAQSVKCASSNGVAQEVQHIHVKRPDGMEAHVEHVQPLHTRANEWEECVEEPRNKVITQICNSFRPLIV